jgi:hypothetical protein
MRKVHLIDFCYRKAKVTLQPLLNISGFKISISKVTAFFHFFKHKKV